MRVRNDIVNIIEKSNVEEPICKNCKSYQDGVCTFGSVNGRNNKVTTPNYSCENFDNLYKFSTNTKDILNNIIKDIDRVDTSIKNLDLLLKGDITEDDFNDFLK